MSEERRFAYCIRITLDSVVEYPGLEKVFKDKADRWFWGRHEAEAGDIKPHVHWYLETSWKEQAIRSCIQRHRKSNSHKGNKLYSLETLRTTLTKYGSYVMLKDHTVESDMCGITEEEVQAMQEYAEDLDSVKKPEEKKSNTYINRLMSEVQYDLYKDDRHNFYKMHDWLVEKSLLNLYTESKMCQIYSLWVMSVMKQRNEKEYKRRRELYYKRVEAQFELTPWGQNSNLII